MESQLFYMESRSADLKHLEPKSTMRSVTSREISGASHGLKPDWLKRRIDFVVLDDELVGT